MCLWQSADVQNRCYCWKIDPRPSAPIRESALRLATSLATRDSGAPHPGYAPTRPKRRISWARLRDVAVRSVPATAVPYVRTETDRTQPAFFDIHPDDLVLALGRRQSGMIDRGSDHQGRSRRHVSFSASANRASDSEQPIGLRVACLHLAEDFCFETQWRKCINYGFQLEGTSPVSTTYLATSRNLTLRCWDARSSTSNACFAVIRSRSMRMPSA